MAKVILICGKLCSGKTTYTEKLKREHKTVLLSCDEITLSLFDGDLGDNHDMMTERIKNYLYNKSLEIVETGVDVILDWGFWMKSWRDYAQDFYKRRNVTFEFHYIDISDELWRLNIAERNEAVISGRTSAYYVDDGLIEKLHNFFEKPSANEIDVWYTNERKE